MCFLSQEVFSCMHASVRFHSYCTFCFATQYQRFVKSNSNQLNCNKYVTNVSNKCNTKSLLQTGMND